MLALAPAAKSLLRREWDGLSIVYQPSSGETHVFNDTTASILACLERSPDAALSLGALTTALEHVLGMEAGAIAEGDLLPAISRLEELGLIDRVGESAPVHATR